MSEERMAILRMVAEGKITTDEAETLLKSLGTEKEEETQTQERRRSRRRAPRPPKPPKPPKPPRGFRGRHMGDFAEGMNEFAHEMSQFAQNVAGDVINSVHDSFASFDREFEDFDQSFDTSPQAFEIEPGTTLFIKSQDGMLTLLGTDEPTLSVSGAPKAHYKVRRNGNRMEVKSKRFGTALTVHIPRSVEQLSVKTELSSVVAKDFTPAPQDIQIETQVGNIDLNLGDVTDGRILIKSQTGRVKLSITEHSGFDLKASKAMGDIDIAIPLANVEQGNGYLIGSYNGGGAKIRMATQVGGIEVALANFESEMA